LFYDLLEAPPDPGSLQEALCILVFRYRQEQKFYGLLVNAQTEHKDRAESFEKYKASLFPYVFKSARDTRDATKEALERAFRLGPIVIRPLKKGENAND
jgi:hypothetical protein